MASIRPLMPDYCDFAAKASEAGASLLGVVDMNEFLCGGARCGAPEYAAWIISLSRSVCSQEMFDTAIWERSGCIADRAVGSPAVGFCFRIVGVKLRIGRCLLMGRLGRCLGALNGRSSLGWRKCFCRCIFAGETAENDGADEAKVVKAHAAVNTADSVARSENLWNDSPLAVKDMCICIHTNAAQRPMNGRADANSKIGRRDEFSGRKRAGKRAAGGAGNAAVFQCFAQIGEVNI